MNRTKMPRFRMLLGLLILSACIGCDQATKTIATHTLQNVPPKSYLGDTIRIHLALNPGGFLSLGSTLPAHFRMLVFLGFNSCIILGLATYVFLKRDIGLGLFMSLVFLLAGSIGNMIDRWSNNGLVTDFLNVGIGPVRTGIFNVADMAMLFGAIAFGWLSLQSDRNSECLAHNGQPEPD